MNRVLPFTASLLMLFLLPVPTFASPTCAPVSVATACVEPSPPGAPPGASASFGTSGCDPCVRGTVSATSGSPSGEPTYDASLIVDRNTAGACQGCAPPGSIEIVRAGMPGWPTADWSALTAGGFFTCSSSLLVPGGGLVGIEVTCIANSQPPSGSWYCGGATARAYGNTGPNVKTTTGCQGTVSVEVNPPGGALSPVTNLGPGSTLTCRAQGSSSDLWEASCNY